MSSFSSITLTIDNRGNITIKPDYDNFPQPIINESVEPELRSSLCELSGKLIKTNNCVYELAPQKSRKLKITCECGCEIDRWSLKRHLSTKKHKVNIR